MTRTLAGFLAVAGLALALAGCSSPAPAESTPENTAANTPANSPENTPVNTPDNTATTEGTSTGTKIELDDKGVPKTAAPEVKMPTDNDDVAVLKTSAGTIVVRFFEDKAPLHVKNYKDLIGKKFYDGTRFHRTMDGFMIQGGDPNSKDMAKSSMWGTGGFMEGGSERTVKAEFSSGIAHKRGVLSMARSTDPNSASSQFFIMHADNPGLDGQYSSFGQVVSGMDVVDIIAKTPVTDGNGTVVPDKAFVLMSVELKKWKDVKAGS